jgi:ubiquinone/menaquinone biosynthesis C-methylase UbiE
MKFHPESVEVSPAAVSKLLMLAEMRRYLHHHLGARNRDLYLSTSGSHEPAAKAESGVAAREAVRAHMEAQPYFQVWSSLLRASQDVMWGVIGREVDRDHGLLQQRWARLGASATQGDDPAREIGVPEYLAAADTHRMPGGYTANRGSDDLRAGAMYDIGGAIYQLGIGNDSGRLLNDSRGRTLVAHLRQHYPGLSVRRVLDLGCGVGHNTLPLVDAFPEAEVVGADVGAAMVRFARLRAEGLGRKATFIQADAESTGLEGGTFDLVVSQILLHETSPAAIHRVLRESARLLRPGGVAIHLEVPLRFADVDAFAQFFMAWEQHYNSESNIEGVAEVSLGDAMRDAGFDEVKEGFQAIPAHGSPTSGEMLSRPGPMGSCWLVASGVKA